METQKVITNLTLEDLITGKDGVTVSRALVNVIIDQQISQQIGVSTLLFVLVPRNSIDYHVRLIRLATSFNRAVDRFAVQTM